MPCSILARAVVETTRTYTGTVRQGLARFAVSVPGGLRYSPHLLFPDDVARRTDDGHSDCLRDLVSGEAEGDELGKRIWGNLDVRRSLLLLSCLNESRGRDGVS